MLGILIFIAVLQGLTEFLPVSSSGHLALASYFLNFKTPETLLFFLVVHAGTACSTLIFFRKDIVVIFQGLVDFVQKKQSQDAKDSLKWLGIILIISIPTAFFGLMFKDFFEEVAYANPKIVPVALFFTAVLILITKWISSNKLTLQEFSYKKAFLVGLAQSLALIPGISRSGSTIAVALLLGASPNFAGKMSFLASLVAIFGALLLEIIHFLKVGSISLPISYFVLGFFTSFLVGMLALKFLTAILSKGKLYLFSLYCFIIGAVFLLLLD